MDILIGTHLIHNVPIWKGAKQFQNYTIQDLRSITFYLTDLDSCLGYDILQPICICVCTYTSKIIYD